MLRRSLKNSGNEHQCIDSLWGPQRKVTVLLLILAVLLTAASCAGSAYDKLVKAQEKTEAAVTGISRTRITLENQFETEGLTGEALRMANYMKKVTYEGTTRFDRTLEQSASDIYLSMGGIGFDLALYSFDGHTYAKLPVMKKYMDVRDLMGVKVEGAQVPEDPEAFLSEAAMDRLSEIWKEIATPDNVKKTGTALLKTSSGDLKTTRYSVQVAPEVIQEALGASMAVIAEDLGRRNPDMDFSLAMGDMKDLVMDEVSMITEVGSNGFVMRESILIRYQQPGLATSIQIEILNDQLNENVALNMPEISPEDLYAQDELEREMPGAMEDLFSTFGIQSKSNRQ